jgi:homocysteine S-methyltransferase
VRYHRAIRNPIAEFLAQQPIMILDGALATELERRGADLHDPLWSAKVLLEHPDLIRTVHQDYYAAGADVATTATYQASFLGFERRGLGPDEAAQLMRNAVALAMAARERFWSNASLRGGRLRPLIAASIGPYGAMLADGSEYRGDYGVGDEELLAFHRPRMRVLVESDADLLACETIPSLREALLLARLLQEFPKASAWISFSCRDGAHTGEGQRIADCVRQLDGFAQVVAVGVNCTRPQYIGALLEQMRGQTDKPLLVYPNSGERYDALGKRWLGGGDVIGLALQAQSWRRAGARLIGGCCRTTPADIRALRDGLAPCA